MGDFKLGQRVECSGYLVKSGNYYEIFEDGRCFRVDGKEVEDYDSCNRYKVRDKKFEGIFVGATTRFTKITVEYGDQPYQEEGFYFRKEEPGTYGIVYYALGKKRLVPMHMIHETKEDEDAIYSLH